MSTSKNIGIIIASILDMKKLLRSRYLFIIALNILIGYYMGIVFFIFNKTLIPAVLIHLHSSFFTCILLITLIPSVLFFVSMLIKLHTILIEYHNTEIPKKYATMFLGLFITVFSFYFINKDLQYTHKDYKKFFAKTLILEGSTIKKKSFLQYEAETSLAINQIKLASFFITQLFILYIFYLLLDIDIRKIDLSLNQFYIRWYLSTQYGWVKGTSSLKNSYLEIKIPDDCVKIIELSLDFFQETKSKLKIDVFSFKYACRQDSQLKNEKLEPYEMANTLKTIFKTYKIEEIKFAERMYGELPKIVWYAKEFNFLTH